MILWLNEIDYQKISMNDNNNCWKIMFNSSELENEKEEEEKSKKKWIKHNENELFSE